MPTCLGHYFGTVVHFERAYLMDWCLLDESTELFVLVACAFALFELVWRGIMYCVLMWL